MRFSVCDGFDTWQCLTCMEETQRTPHLQQWLWTHAEYQASWCPHHQVYRTAVFNLNPFRASETSGDDFICAHDYGHGYLEEVPCDGGRPPRPEPVDSPTSMFFPALETPPQAAGPVPVVVVADDEDVDLDINLDIIQRIVDSHQDELIDEGFNTAFDIVEGWA